MFIDPTKDSSGNQIPRTGMVYDPVVRGFDASFFSTISGTPSIVSNKLRLTSAVISSFYQFLFGIYHFYVNIPIAPTAGQARKIGLALPSKTTLGSAYFEVKGAVFSAVSYDEDGDKQETVIPFTAGWAGAEKKYSIQWEKDYVIFLIEDTAVATHKTSVGKTYQSLYINNGSADNVDITNIIIEQAGKLI